MLAPMQIVDTDVWVTNDVSAISLSIEYPDHDMIEHDMMYVMYETGEPSEGGVTYEEAYEMAQNLVLFSNQ